MARAKDREQIVVMTRDFADFMTKRQYAIWNLNRPEQSMVNFAYSNAIYVLAQAVAFRLTGDQRYCDEALRLAELARWRERTHLEEWAEQGHKRFLKMEYMPCGMYIVRALETLHEILPELFGSTPPAAREGLARVMGMWWDLSRLGVDEDGYQHYWVDIDVINKTWKPTGLRPNAEPQLPGTFFSYFSDIRMGDSLYRLVNAALPVIAHLPGRKHEVLKWMREVMEKTSGQRLHWLIDLDGQQLKPDVKWMGCILSSEAPFEYLITYWRGRKLGYWS